MTEQSIAQTSMLDKFKLVLAALIVLGGVVAYYHFAEYPVLYRVLGVLGAAVIAVLFSLTSAPGRQFVAFARESRIELARVIWPSRRETWQATLLVVAMVFLVGLMLWLFDMILVWGIRFLTGQGG